jgi:hypothetical protein
MTTQPIESLFRHNIYRRIEEVIKVDQTEDKLIAGEIKEYVVTDAIRAHYVNILDLYRDTPNKPHEGIAVWVSGFFGSGKSSFAKMLGLAVENRDIEGKPAAGLFAAQAKDPKLAVLLSVITEQIKTHTVIFDVSTDRGIRSGNQTLTEIMYGRLLQSLRYAKDLDLSELEIALEEKGQLAAFEAEYRKTFDKDWDAQKGKIAFALSEASRVLHNLEPATYPFADSWVKAVKNKADITPGKLAERATELMKRREPGKSLMFVIDEVGQFVARDVQKMLDLQAVVQNLGIRGRGKHWIVVTSQEKLNDIVSGLDETRVELARLKDRFPQQVHLEPSDISEVTSKRVLSKNAEAEAVLGKLFDEHRGRLTEHTRLTADIKLPDLARDSFIDLYPLLPYQIDLIIQIVSGLRTQGGTSKHVGGANRTIIKLAQQLLIHPAVNLAEHGIGELVRLDQVYDLVADNIDSELRAKISSIPKQLVQPHPLAESVAKVICLLQYVKSVHRTAENIAAALHAGIGADSQLAAVKEALVQLEAAHKVRKGDGGYRIPTPAEDDWERTRNGINPKPGDAHRIYSEVLNGFWTPAPTFAFLETRTFKAGLFIHGREVVPGDTKFELHLADEGENFKTFSDELRVRSQRERESVFWSIALTPEIDRETVELFRSKEMVALKGREASTRDQTTLLDEEQRRARQRHDELRRLLKAACLAGSVYFRGNDRSPGARATDVGKSVSEILGNVLPEVFDRFKEAAAKPKDVKAGVDALFTAANLQGLPPVFSQLGLLRDEKGKTVFRIESGPLAEVLSRIEERANYGDTASGRFLAEALASQPFGWELEVVRLLVLSLLRAGKIEATSKGQTIDSLTGVEARDTFNNNNLFKAASFRPKRGIEFEELVKASEAFRDTFGSEVREINASAITVELRREVARNEDSVASANARLAAHRLPGGGVLDAALGPMKAILRGTEENAISTFNASHRSIKDAIKRSAELEQALTEPRLNDLARARQVLTVAWPFLKTEADLDEAFRSRAATLEDSLARETFFRDLPAIEQHAHAIEAEYARRLDDALQARIDTYASAFQRLTRTPGWSDLDPEGQRTIAAPIHRGMHRSAESVPIPLLRSERDACEPRLSAAVEAVHRALDGDRLVTINLASYFAGGIDSEEQLDAALQGIRDECARLIGAGKKVILS